MKQLLDKVKQQVTTSQYRNICCTILFKTKIDKIDQIYIFRQADIERIQHVTPSSLRIIIVVLMIPM